MTYTPLTWICSCSPRNNLEGKTFYFTGAQRGDITLLKSQSRLVAEPGFKLGLPVPLGEGWTFSYFSALFDCADVGSRDLPRKLSRF